MIVFVNHCMSVLKFWFIGFVVFLFVLETSLCLAQERWERYILVSNTTAGRTVEESSGYWVVQLTDKKRTSLLLEDKLQVVKKLDDEVLLVRTEDDLSDLAYINAYWPANNLWKLSTVSDETLLHNNMSASWLVKLDTPLLKDPSWLENLDPVSINRGVYRCNRCDVTMIWSMIADPTVISITQESQVPHVESLVQDMNLQVNTVNKMHHVYPSYRGEGQVVSIQESLYDTTDVDLRGRHVSSPLSSSSQVDSHATDMATIIAGAGNSFITGRGVLDAASITSSDFIGVLPDEDADYSALGVQVQNHSYGTAIESFYGIQAQAYDESARNNPSLLHVFSSGNQGGQPSETGLYAGLASWANLTGNYKMSKNSLAVGAVDAEGRIVPFSSRGPTYDGRVKPEVVAYGQSGSSNAAALVSGVAGMLHQIGLEQTGEALSSSTIKALLINHADDVGAEGLDHISGYGNVDAYSAVQGLMNQQYFTDTIRSDETSSLTIQIPPNVSELKVALCWTDPAAAVGDVSALVNDLDLTVVTPSSAEVLPWVLNTQPSAAALEQSATRQPDHLNNVEQVTLSSPESGEYTIRIMGYDVSMEPQAFSVVYSWELRDAFEWSYPTASDVLPHDGGTNSYLYWSSTLGGVGELEYQYGESEWLLLDDSVGLSQGYWSWEGVPDLDGLAHLRMTVGDQVFESDTFVVSRPLSIDVAFDCTDSVMLYWEEPSNAMYYELSTMGDTYLQTVRFTPDTFTVLNKSGMISSLYTVRAAFGGGQYTPASYLTDYEAYGGACYISYFYQEELPDGINLQLALGTTVGVANVQIDRKVGEGYEQVALIDKVDSRMIEAFDSQPVEGLNEHRVTVHLTNGQKLEAFASEAYYLQPSQLALYPNPVRSSELLTVITSQQLFDAVFKLYHSSGQEVYHRVLNSAREGIRLDGLPSGLYFYSLETDGISQVKGRLMVLD